jgi:hypothetical protein
MSSVSAVDWVLVTRDASIEIGDIVSTDAGGMPVYRVVALAGGKAVLNDEQHSASLEMPVDRFHWKAALSRA